MTIATMSFQPVASWEYLDRFEALLPGFELTPELWTNVNDEFQEPLALLETEIRRNLASVRVEIGRTKGEKFFLFSYRTFSLPGSTIDPVVVGITFAPAHLGVTVEADASGERNGDTISSVPGKTVGNSREELLEAARISARELCQSGAAIVTALQDASRMDE